MDWSWMDVLKYLVVASGSGFIFCVCVVTIERTLRGDKTDV